MTAPATPPIDPGALIRSRGYIGLLVLAGVVGIVVSVAGWLFLELTVAMQHWLYQDLPTALGFASAPAWWPMPFLAVAGLLVAVAIVRLPGRGGHRPAGGLHAGATAPVELPGVLLAAVATIGLGAVLGPEAPLIAIGGALGMLTIGMVRQGAPDQAKAVMAAAGAFAAISTIFGNPVIGAVIIIEAAGLGGATLPLVLLPGLVAAGIGSVVFVGMGTATGLSTTAYSLPPLDLPASPPLSVYEFVWAVLLAIIGAIIVRAIIEVAWAVEGVVMRRPMVMIPIVGVAIGALAAGYAFVTGEPADAVLFSGQDAMGPLVDMAPTLPVTTLTALLLFKGLAWGLSLSSFRGGPTFPAMFLGLLGGLIAANVLGLSETTMAAIGIGAMTVSMLRLPLASVILAMVVTASGLSTAPLIIVSVVVAYIVTERLGARRRPPPVVDTASPTASAPTATGAPAPG